MTYLAPVIQRDSLTNQKSAVEYQTLIVSSNVQQVTSSLSVLAGSDADMESNEVKQLQYLSQLYTHQQASLDSQLKSINTQLDGLNKLIDTNIKNDCKLNLLG